MRKCIKGQHEVLSLILITTVLLSIMAIVWLWVVPIIEKNKEVLLLSKTEDFTKTVAESVAMIARNGGKAEISMAGLDPRGTIVIDENSIQLLTYSSGTIYEAGQQIPFNELGCYDTEGILGLNSTATICAESLLLAKNKYKTKFTITFVTLNYGINKAYKIDLLPITSLSGLSKNSMILENKGVKEHIGSGRTLISTLVAINII